MFNNNNFTFNNIIIYTRINYKIFTNRILAQQKNEKRLL